MCIFLQKLTIQIVYFFPPELLLHSEPLTMHPTTIDCRLTCVRLIWTGCTLSHWHWRTERGGGAASVLYEASPSPHHPPGATHRPLGARVQGGFFEPKARLENIFIVKSYSIQNILSLTKERWQKKSELNGNA